jgi:cytochrome c oxidase cbb3-type subunit II
MSDEKQDSQTQGQPKPHNTRSPHSPIIDRVEKSSILMVIGIILLFSTAVIVTLIAPRYVDSTWTSPSSPYQVQMYEIEDPYVYISSRASGGQNLQYVHHLKQNFTLLAFRESPQLRILSTPDLEKYVTREGEELKLTSRLLLLREPEGEMQQRAERIQNEGTEREGVRVRHQILELYNPRLEDAFAINPSGGQLEDWVDESYQLLEEPKHPYQENEGVVYVLNPTEFRLSRVRFGNQESWRYDPHGKAIKSLEELQNSFDMESISIQLRDVGIATPIKRARLCKMWF